MPSNFAEVRRIKYNASNYTIINEVLYKWRYATPCSQYVITAKGMRLFQQAHDGVCRNHCGGRKLAKKILRQGFYQPTVKQDALNMQRSAIIAKSLLKF